MKISYLAFFIAIISLLSGCSYNQSEPTALQLAKETQETIVNGFANNDPQSIERLFSPYICSSSDLDTQIQSAFEYIEGKIVSYDPPEFSASPAETDGSGQVKYGMYGRTENICTDKGTEYAINFKGWYTYRDDTAKEGVYLIHIVNITEKEKYNGTVDWAACSINIGNEVY